MGISKFEKVKKPLFGKKSFNGRLESGPRKLTISPGDPLGQRWADIVLFCCCCFSHFHRRSVYCDVIELNGGSLDLFGTSIYTRVSMWEGGGGPFDG